jgi:hypothetical protein
VRTPNLPTLHTFVPVLASRCTHKPECVRVATFTQLASRNWRVQVRCKTRYVAETFRRRKDGEEWALEMERNIDRRAAAAWTPVEDELSKPGAIEGAKAGKNAPPLSDVIGRYIAESEKAIGKTKAQVLRASRRTPLAARHVPGSTPRSYAISRRAAHGIGYSATAPMGSAPPSRALARRRTARCSGADSPGRPESHRWASLLRPPCSWMPRPPRKLSPDESGV